jgi:hypothetical protein
MRDHAPRLLVTAVLFACLSSAALAEAHGIDASSVWRGGVEVFSGEQLAKIEPILKAGRCKDLKKGCSYRNDGRPVKESDADIRIIPWQVSAHPGFLVRADRCGAGGCDEGLFVRIDGKWRLLIESFGVLERDGTSTRGFRDLLFRPRGGDPVRLIWDGTSYQVELTPVPPRR